MGFLEEHFDRDYSSASLDELLALKEKNEQRAIEAEARNQAVLDHMPLWLNMTNTTRCNLRCIMCNQAYGRTEIMSMEPAIYDLIVRQFYPFLRTVQLTAIGEPMMTPKLPSKIDDMLRYGVRLEMVTNGTLLKGDRLLEKLASASELITISLDGATPETFNSLRHGADFDEIIGNIERFNRFRMAHPPEERTHLDFNYILMKRNIRELPAFVDLAANLGARKVICSHLVLYEEGLEDEMLIRAPGLSNAFTAAAAARATARGIEISLPPPFPDPLAIREGPIDPLQESAAMKSDPLPAEDGTVADEADEYEGEKCYFLWRRVYIGPHGEVVPCCLSGIPSMGDLGERPFPEIWNNESYQRLRRRVHTINPPAPCKDCYLINRNPSSAEFKKI
ncbi:MAG: radical SAM protein [Planctomycetota bacterium]|jgi:radical SAM protein with 4Fe4S-binding SPASM domain